MKVTIECNHIGLIKLVQAIENISADFERFEVDPYRDDVESVTRELSGQVEYNERQFEKGIQKIKEELEDINEYVWPVG